MQKFMIAVMHLILKNKKILFILSILAVFFVGWFSHSLLMRDEFLNARKTVPLRENSKEYKYINPFLFLDNAEDAFHELDGLKKEVENYINDAKDDKKAQKVSFYYREMDKSKWTGVNENELYTPSSMLKVIILMAYFRLAENNPEIASEKIYYEYKKEEGQHFDVLPMKDGWYSTIDLVEQMIIQSDNTAMKLLWEKNSDKMEKIFTDLRLPSTNKNSNDFMSALQYSRIFRTLYNSTYLSRVNSEYTLSLLARTSFKDGINKLLPKDITVAHKFGEFTLYSDSVFQYRELHDCGIVYYPKKPYFICVMTKGSDFANLEKIINDISKIVFDYQKFNNQF